MKTHWQQYPTPEAVAQAACEDILKFAEESIDTYGFFRIVFAGGSTPKRVYQLLAQKHTDWQNWEVYLGDERCLPVNHPERNSQMIQSSLLNHVPIPADNIFMIPAELGAEEAAKQYADIVLNAQPFDLVMLGMGEDGHTASLFPGHKHTPDELVHAVHEAPKPPSDRVSLSRVCLSNNQHLMILITGSRKQAAVKHWRSGKDIPIAKITSKEVRTIFFDATISTNHAKV